MGVLSSRNLQILGVLTAVLLVGLLFYPGTLVSPYTQDQPHQYNHMLVSEWDGDGDLSVYQYDELSPVAQELFDRARNTEPLGQPGTRSYQLDVCQDFMLICDTYYQEELPDEFTYGLNLPPSEAHVIVEDGNERYILKTGGNDPGTWLFAPGALSSLFTLISSAMLIIFAVGVNHKLGTTAGDRMLGIITAGGMMVGTLALLAPYLELSGLITAQGVRSLLYYKIFFGITATAAVALIIFGVDESESV